MPVDRRPTATETELHDVGGKDAVDRKLGRGSLTLTPDRNARELFTVVRLISRRVPSERVVRGGTHHASVVRRRRLRYYYGRSRGQTYDVLVKPFVSFLSRYRPDTVRETHRCRRVHARRFPRAPYRPLRGRVNEPYVPRVFFVIDGMENFDGRRVGSGGFFSVSNARRNTYGRSRTRAEPFRRRDKYIRFSDDEISVSAGPSR